jgi:hypothetical protein
MALEYPITFNGITMNDDSKSEFSGQLYWIEVRSFDGLFDDDLSYEAHPIPGYVGERSGDVFRRGKTITLTGFLWASNLEQLRISERLMQQAFWDCKPYNLVFQRWKEPQLYIKCRVSQPLKIVEQQEDEKMRRPFTVAFRADEPRSKKVADDSFYPTFQTDMST